MHKFYIRMLAVLVILLPPFNAIKAQASDPDNLISNPSVEEGTTMPVNWLKGGWGANTRVLSYPVAGNNSAKAIKTEITQYTSGDAKWYFQYVPVISGKKYIYTDNFSSNQQSFVTIQFLMNDGTFKYLDLSIEPSTNGSWQSTEGTFTVPSNTMSLTIFHLIKNVGWLVTDNHTLKEVVSPPPSSNLVPNSQLEVSGNATTPADWARGGWGANTRALTYPALGRDGTRGAKVTITQYTNGDVKWYFNHQPVIPNRDYVFADDYLSNTYSYLTAQVQLTNSSYQYIDLGTLSPTSEWKHFQTNFLVPENAVSATIFHLIKSVGELTVDNYFLQLLPAKQFPVGMVTFDFDDGLSSVYQNAIPILNKAGFKSSQFIITQKLGTPGFMTVAQVQAMKNGGHEIAAHTRTHPHLPELSQQQMQNEIIGSANDLEGMGFTIDSFAYPYGEYNDVVQNIVRSGTFTNNRTVMVGYNNKYTDPFLLRDQHIRSTTTFLDVKNWIDYAIRNKIWVILEFHDIDTSGSTYSMSPTVLQQIVDYIKENNVLVVTNQEGFSRINE